MKKDPLYHFLRKSESCGLLCNQSAWHAGQGYSFHWLQQYARIRKVFIPEHGLFGELQDQVKQDSTQAYRQLDENVEWISLYTAGANGYTATDEQLSSIDTLVIDLQDVGARYYTFIYTIALLFEKITRLQLSIRVVVLDKPNPAGRQVEGSRISATYASFIGYEGLPHRHGLTLGELCHWLRNRLRADWDLVVVPPKKKEWVFIPPSPNIPTRDTCKLYSGQCLWEGTIASEGRGTTLPFQVVGAPWMQWVMSDAWNRKKHPAYDANCFIRPLQFIPVFHKFTNDLCYGIQLLPQKGSDYHSLAHSLKLIHYARERTPQLMWREGSYEAFNQRSAIELLAGDSLVLQYLDHKASWKETAQHLDEEERNWIREATPYLLYKRSLQKLKLN